jgi:hypothetical protein
VFIKILCTFIVVKLYYLVIKLYILFSNDCIVNKSIPTKVKTSYCAFREFHILEKKTNNLQNDSPSPIQAKNYVGEESRQLNPQVADSHIEPV